ncbi:S-methyl-5'-thioadenosine phosphorylase [Pelomyxa schiedti]|nr:S-methyl-5'-thioadenosine phosphorylase [Pelomyxa schiedti]
MTTSAANPPVVSEAPVALIGVIGGTGFYQFPGLTDVRTYPQLADTPFGAASSAPLVGTLRGKRVAFIARHGTGHDRLPSEVNYVANMWALKSLGVKFVLAVSAVGSLKIEHKPMDVVLPLQFIDKTFKRRNTIFGDGIVGHVGFAHPISEELAKIVLEASKTVGLSVPVTLGGTYVCIEGPLFSTKAESELHRSWGCAVVGMTGATEARIAREAELAYATIALVTDYDCWREEEADQVSTETVVRYLRANAENAQKIVTATVAMLDTSMDMKAHHALEFSIMNKATIPPATKEKLDVFLHRHLL